MTCGVRSRVPAVWCVWLAAGLLIRSVAGGEFCNVADLVINPQSATLEAACASLGDKVPKDKTCKYTLAGHECSYITCLDDPVQGAVWNRLGSLCFEEGCQYDDLDTSAIPTATAQQYCEKGSIVKKSDSCLFTVAGKMCDEPKCIGNGWDFTAPKCYDIGTRCYGRDLNSDLTGAVMPVGQGGGMLYAIGAKLALMRGDPAVPCSEVACGVSGTWASDSVCPPGKKCPVAGLRYVMYPTQGIPDTVDAVTSPCLGNTNVDDGESCAFAPALGPNPALALLKGATCSIRKCIDGKWNGRGKVYCGCDAANTAHLTFNLQGGITLDEIESGNSGVAGLNDPILFAVAGGSCEGCLCAPANPGVSDVQFVCGTGTPKVAKCVRPSCSTHHFTVSGYTSAQCPQGTLIPDKTKCTVTRDTIANSICDKAVCMVDQIEPPSPRCAPAAGACLFDLPMPAGADATLRTGCKPDFIVLKDDLCEFYNAMDATTKCDRPKCTGGNTWDKVGLQCHDNGCHINALPPAGVTPVDVRCGEDHAMAAGQFCNYVDMAKPTMECERKKCVDGNDIDEIVCHLDGCPYDSDADFWTHIKPLPAAGTFTVTGDPGCVQYGVIPKDGKCSFRSPTWNCDATCFAHTSLRFNCFCLQSELTIPNEVRAIATCPEDTVPAAPTTCVFTHMNGDMCGDHICSQPIMSEPPKWDNLVVQCGGKCRTDNLPNAPSGSVLMLPAECGPGKEVGEGVVCASKVPGRMPEPCYEIKCENMAWVAVRDDCVDSCIGFSCNMPLVDSPTKGTTVCMGKPCLQSECCVCSTDDAGFKKAPTYLVQSNPVICAVGTRHAVNTGKCGYRFSGPASVKVKCYELTCQETGWVETMNTCTDPCSMHTCTAPWTDKPTKATLGCPAAGCSDPVCCNGGGCLTNELPPVKPHLQLADTTQCAAGKTAAIDVVCAVRVPGQPPCFEEKCTAAGWDNVKDSCPDPCSMHTCQGQWIDKPSKNTLVCPAAGCTDDACCIRQCLTNDLTIGPHLVPVDTAQCSAGKTVSADVVCAFKVPGQTPCYEKRCTATGWTPVKNDCPDPCAPYVCTAPWTDRVNKATLPCPPTGGCTDTSCCKKPCKTQNIVVAPHLQPVDAAQCSTGKVTPLDVVCAFQVPGQPPCFEEKCTAAGWTNVKDSCPLPCSSHVCTGQYIDKPDKATLVCLLGGCTDAVCCDGTCAGYTCPVVQKPNANTIQCGAPGPLCSVALCCAPALPTAAPPTLAPLIMPTLSPGMLARPCPFAGVAADVDAAVSDPGCRSGGSVPPKGVCYVYQGGGACQRMQCADTGAWVSEVCPNTPPAVTCSAGGSPPCVVELYEDGSQMASVGAAGTATLTAAGLLAVSPFSDGVGAGEKRQTVQGTCTCNGAGCTSATVDAASGKVTASVTANAAAAVVMVSCTFADNGSPAQSTPSTAVAYLKILAVNDVPLATLVKTRARVAVNESHAVDEKMEILRQVMAGPAGARDEDKQVISGSCTGDSAVFDGQPTLHFASAASGGTVTVPTTATMMYRVRAGAPTGETSVTCEVRDGAGGVTKLAPVTIEVVRMAVQAPTQEEKDAVTPKQVREDGSTMSFRIDGAGFPANLTGASLAFIVVGPDGKALKFGVGPPVLTVYSDRSADDAPNGVLATMAKDPTFIKVSVSDDGKSMQMTMKGGDYAAVSPKDEKLRIKLSQSVFGVENPDVVCAAGTCEDSLTIASESPRFPNQEQLTDTQNAAVAVTSVSSVVLAAGASTGTKTGILAMTTRAMLCPGDGPDKLDRTLNPLGLRIGDGKYKEYNGAVIGAALVNSALLLICTCAAVFVLHMLGKSHGVSLGSFVRNDLSTKIDRRYVLMKARFGWTLIPMSFLYGGATVAAITTVVYSDTFFRVLGGALTALFVIGLPVYSFRAAAHVNKFTEYVPIESDVPGQALSWKTRFFWGQMEYVPKEDKVGSRTWTALHHLTFDGYTHWWRYFLFIELIVMMFLSVFTAWQPDTQRSCWIRAVLMTCVLVVFTLILVLGRPYLAIYENIFESLIAITETVMMILTCSAMGDDNPAKSWQADVSGKLGVGCVYLILLKFIIDSTIFVIDEFTTWKEEGGSGKLVDFAKFWFFFQGATADEGAFVALDKQGLGLKDLQVTAFEGEDLESDRSSSDPEHAAQQQQLAPLRSASAPSPALAVPGAAAGHRSSRRLSTFAAAMPASGGSNPMVRKTTRSYTPVDPDVMDGGGESLRELAAAYPRERSFNGSDGESSMGGSGVGAGRGTTGSPLVAKPAGAAVPRPKRSRAISAVTSKAEVDSTGASSTPRPAPEDAGTILYF